MLADHVTIARRFQRSIRLDSDLGRADALEGFVCQRSGADGLINMAMQIANTKQRAFTWTGPYGGGKSSLAVTLAALLGPKGALRNAAIEALGAQTAKRVLDLLEPSRDGWLVIPVVGRRGDAVADIGTALEQARRQRRSGRGRPRNDVESGRELIDRLGQEAQARPKDGVLLIIDELGKFLEGAAAEGGDIFFFQDLAESAARCKGRLVVIGILHQAFEQYASRLAQETRDEWAKIQGRFVDIPLIAGIDEVVELLGRAIVTKKRHSMSALSCDAVAQSIRSRRPGSPANLSARLDRCWPLHPVTAAVLGPMSRRRFGQNERSVFGFLTSAEPGGFQEFLRTTTDGSGVMFGPERFWDYLRINLEPAILASSDSHRWAQGADIVEQSEARGNEVHVTLAKSIALIDMFRNGSGLAADRLTLGTCVAGVPETTVDEALKDLERWSVAIFRKHMNAWSPYAGSDFDIDGALTSALAQATGVDLTRLARLAGLQPILAKRHYHETGTLRWFSTELVHLSDLNRALMRTDDAAGHFLLVLPEADGNVRAAAAACRSASSTSNDQLVAIGLSRNACRIRDLGRELVGLEAVRAGRPELDGDSVARRELAARIAAVSAELEEELREGFAGAEWYANGARVELPAGASLSRLASDLADDRFNNCPRIHSELVNRQRPSSNTQAGVRDLMHTMISDAAKSGLGIEGFPIHGGLYSTVLSPAGLHKDRGDGRFGFAEPNNSKIGRTFRPAWTAAKELFANDPGPVSLDRLYGVWEAPPYGIRRGVMPIFALAFLLAHRDRLAMYGEGKFQSDVDDYLVDILLQDEKLVALRHVDLGGSRKVLLSSVARAVEAASGAPCPTDPLELARRLVRLVTELPPWTRKTLGLAPQTAEVRRILLHADDPHKALFIDLPAVFGESDADAAATGIETALRELSAAYPAMLVEISRKMLSALGHPPDADLSEIRARAGIISDLTGDLRLDAFATELAGFEGQPSQIEAIASLSINKPPRDWSDREPDQAALALAELALKFRRAEALARVKGRHPAREAMALIIGTGEVGSELIEEFEVADRDRPRVTAIAQVLNDVLAQSGADRSVLLAALVEAGQNTIVQPRARLRKVV
jgi:hypothetical protein